VAAKKVDSPLIVIAGETASGKSRFAVKLAKHFNGEIIAADSWTVYEGFDIGTAKPSQKDQQHVPHHLLDVTKPQNGFSAAEYKRLAVAAINDISNRGKLPIIVGGTGLYIDSVIFNFSFLPSSTPEVRSELNGLTINELLIRLGNGNIDTTGIDLRNKRRLIRLLESEGARPNKSGLRPNTLILGVYVPRDKLRAKIESRIDKMLENGLEKEVRSLADKYGWDIEPMKGIGYREFRDYFSGDQTLEKTHEIIINASLNLAKRQRTWFKRNKSIQTVTSLAEAKQAIEKFLNT
jgi:tRNA dimethylallyltransferase